MHKRFHRTGNPRTMCCHAPYGQNGMKQDTMSLSQAQKKAMRSIGHHLDPVVTASENGISEGMLAELERALNDHELVKVKLAIPDRDDRTAVLDELVAQSRSELIQKIGKVALLYRKNPKATRSCPTSPASRTTTAATDAPASLRHHRAPTSLSPEKTPPRQDSWRGGVVWIEGAGSRCARRR